MKDLARVTNFSAINLLEGRNLNINKVCFSSSLEITKSFSHIIKVFEDFRFVQELREEIAKVKPCLAINSFSY
jgi:hypothetical protein